MTERGAWSLSTERHPAPSSLRADLEAYLRARGAAEHASAVGLSVSLADDGSSIDVSATCTRRR
jgi:hypothetical protein